MKVFIASFVAMIVIAVLAGVALTTIDDSSRATYQSEQGATRL